MDESGTIATSVGTSCRYREVITCRGGSISDLGAYKQATMNGVFEQTRSLAVPPVLSRKEILDETRSRVPCGRQDCKF